MADFEWMKKLSELVAAGEPCVLITVIEAKGSTPREAGVKMIATIDKIFSTIGGGNLEFQAVAEARALLLKARPESVARHYPLGPKLAQCCGGAVTIFLEPFVLQKKELWIFGAGHVGKEVVKVMEGLPVKIKWIDSRTTEFPDLLAANTEKIIAPVPEALLAQATEGAFVLVMTHSHDTDYSIVRAAVSRGGFSYIGVIGSETKRVKFRKRLETENLPASHMTCPIGIDGIGGKHPREIAISVAAELLSLGLGGKEAANDGAYEGCGGKSCDACGGKGLP